MSIINDALKKAAKNKQVVYGKPIPVLSAIEEIKTDAQKFILRRWLVWATTGAVCLLGIVLVSTSFKKPVNPISKDKTTSVKLETKSGVKAQGAPSASKDKKKLLFPVRHSDFILSGILYDQEKPLAIINERIVSEGASINGAKLVEVKLNSVKLSLKGKEFILKLK